MIVCLLIGLPRHFVPRNDSKESFVIARRHDKAIQ